MTDFLAPARGRSVQAARLRTNYLEEGSGAPLLLLHGSGAGVSAWANWRHTLPALAPRFRALAPDISGFGFTETPAGLRYGLVHWVDHAIGFLDALGIERTHVLGNSFGGALAVALAARHPQRFHRVVLMGAVGTLFTPPPTPKAFAQFAAGPSPDTMRAYLSHFTQLPALLDDEGVLSRYQAFTRPGYADVYRSLFPSQDRYSGLITRDEELAALPHDVLLVHGREDEIIPMEASLRFHRLIPRSQLHVFGRCGHWSHLDHAQDFNRLVIDFLGRP